MLRTTVFGVAGLSAAALIGCSDDDDDDSAVVGGDVDPGTRSALPEAKTFDLVAGWVKQQATEYYDFGMQSPLNTATSAVGVAAIYPFVTGIVDGMPQFVDGQHNVIDVVPGDEGYSDLWEVNLVMVDDSYVANSITSKAGIEAAGFEVVKPGLFVNCPVVGANSTLEEGPELTTGWYCDEPVFYPDFGRNDPLAIPIWVFINGFNDDGTPEFFEGQNNIIDKVPGDEGYSDLCRVNLVTVDAAYEANTLTSAAQVLASSLEVTETDLVVNCPVVRPDSDSLSGEPRPPALVRSARPEAKAFDLVDGWYRGDDVTYFDFGMQSPLNPSNNQVGIAPIYAFATGVGANGPDFLEGQRNVIDLVTGDEGYSDLWEVHLVIVDGDYEAGTNTSKRQVEASRFEIRKPELLVNCPVVGEGSVLEIGQQLVSGYYRETEVFYPDFGANIPAAIPIWAFVTGFDDDGNPQFVEGQRNIIDAIPSDDGYSAFWRLNLVVVDAGYVANTLKSADEVAASGFAVMETPLLVNCPVVDA